MKKRGLRRFVVILLAVLMLCALVFPASGSSSIYFMAINENIHEMTAENMPMVTGAVLYVPYTMFSPQITGINMGVRTQYNASRGVLTVTDGEKTVTFDIRKNTTYDNTGTALEEWAIVRNSMAFLPVDWLCEYFPSLTYSLSRTPHGVLVRVTNESVILTDAEFVDAAVELLYANLVRYQNSLSSPTPDPSPSPTVTVTPTPTPTPTPPPTQEPVPTPTVCLALSAGEHTAEAADALESFGERALFLFTIGDLVRQDDLVRRLVGRGHQVGLALTGSDPDSCLAQLAAGRQLMADIARCPVLIVSADELALEHHQALRDAGCALWSATHRAEGTDPSSLLEGLDPDRVNFLEFPCDKTGVSLLSRSLSALIGDGFRLRWALAPTL